MFPVEGDRKSLDVDTDDSASEDSTLGAEVIGFSFDTDILRDNCKQFGFLVILLTYWTSAFLSLSLLTSGVEGFCFSAVGGEEICLRIVGGG